MQHTYKQYNVTTTRRLDMQLFIGCSYANVAIPVSSNNYPWSFGSVYILQGLSDGLVLD